MSETKRTKATITVSRTIQLQPFTPYKIEIATEIENSDGINVDDIDVESIYLREYVDACINDVLNNMKENKE